MTVLILLIRRIDEERGNAEITIVSEELDDRVVIGKQRSRNATSCSRVDGLERLLPRGSRCRDVQKGHS